MVWSIICILFRLVVQGLKRVENHCLKGNAGRNAHLKKMQYIYLIKCKITHPYILNEIKSQITKYKKENKNIVLDAALLLDKIRYRRMVDVVIMIHASQDLRIKRKGKREFSKDEFLVRQKRQLSYMDYRKRSDYMVLNNGSTNALKRKLLKVINKLH